MKRGDLIAVVLPREYGKPRPAIVVQSDDFEHLNSVTVIPLTSDTLSLEVFRIDIAPSEQNGLHLPSQVMIDKIAGLPRSRVGVRIGHLSDDDMDRVNRALAVFLGFA